MLSNCWTAHVCVPHSTPCNILVLQFAEVVPQGSVQHPAAPCSDPALADHSFSGGHHMVCLHWRWLLCGSQSHTPHKCNQFHPGHQPGLHHCIERPVDHCLAGLHGQCHVGVGVPYPVQVCVYATLSCVHWYHIQFMQYTAPSPAGDWVCM